jgi:DNA-binding protein H-NS
MKMSHAEYQIPDLSSPELEQMRVTLDARILAKRAEERVEAARTLSEQAKTMGFSIRELIPLLDDLAEKSVKYRHPDKPDLTWCGRGRRPLWLNEAVDSGIDIAKIRV